MKIVALGHKARNGKDTVAQLMLEQDPRRVKIYSFGNALKSFCRVMGWMTTKDGPLLQTIGTEVFRRVDPDKWVRMLSWQIEEEAPAIAVISDLRFINEAEWVKSMGGVTVKIQRIRSDGEPYIAMDRPADHPSEIALDDYPFDLTYRALDGDWERLQHIAQDIYLHHTTESTQEGSNENHILLHAV